MRHIARDIRQAVRLLVKQPAFSLVAVLVLALGIGANTAVFTLVNVLLFKPMVGDGLRAAVAIYGRDSTRPGSCRSFSCPRSVDVRDYRRLVGGGPPAGAARHTDGADSGPALGVNEDPTASPLRARARGFP